MLFVTCAPLLCLRGRLGKNANTSHRIRLETIATKNTAGA